MIRVLWWKWIFTFSFEKEPESIIPKSSDSMNYVVVTFLSDKSHSSFPPACTRFARLHSWSRQCRLIVCNRHHMCPLCRRSWNICSLPTLPLIFCRHPVSPLSSLQDLYTKTESQQSREKEVCRRQCCFGCLWNFKDLHCKIEFNTFLSF